jgi:mono/diheme cytochrome c family protein
MNWSLVHARACRPPALLMLACVFALGTPARGTGLGLGPPQAPAAVATVEVRQRTPVAVITTQQAAAGRAAYAASCAACHQPDLTGRDEAPPLAGTNFISVWGSRGIKDLLDYTSATMPQGADPLDAATYLSVVAYILQRNGAVAGDRPLTASTSERIERVTAGQTGARATRVETP